MDVQRYSLCIDLTVISLFSEQVLRGVKAEQRPQGGLDETVCLSCSRETREHTDA